MRGEHLAKGCEVGSAHPRLALRRTAEEELEARREGTREEEEEGKRKGGGRGSWGPESSSARVLAVRTWPATECWAMSWPHGPVPLLPPTLRVPIRNLGGPQLPARMNHGVRRPPACGQCPVRSHGEAAGSGRGLAEGCVSQGWGARWGSQPLPGLGHL